MIRPSSGLSPPTALDTGRLKPRRSRPSRLWPAPGRSEIQKAQGFDGALAAPAHAPYGEVLLGVVALGLILFGIYSALCAKWVQTGPRN